MPKIVLLNPHIEIGGSNLSAFFNQVTIEYAADEVEDSTFGQNTHSFQGGLLDWTITLNGFNAYESGEADAILWGFVTSRAGQAFDIRPTSAVPAVNNPSYQATALVRGYSPISGSLGEMTTVPVTLRPHSSGPELQRVIA